MIRAALEAIAYQSKDLLDSIVSDTGINPEQLKVDGGASSNDFLMQFQADILNKPICRPLLKETTALGAAYLAGLSTGFWKNKAMLPTSDKTEKTYYPRMCGEERNKLLSGWHKAVERAKSWAEEN